MNKENKKNETKLNLIASINSGVSNDFSFYYLYLFKKKLTVSNQSETTAIRIPEAIITKTDPSVVKSKGL